jgi:hypothetical protein
MDENRLLKAGILLNYKLDGNRGLRGSKTSWKDEFI